MTEVGFTDLSALGAGGGNKPSTQRGRDAALTHFTNFLSFIKVIEDRDVANWETEKILLIENVLCQENLLRRLETYLIDHAKRQDGLPLDSSTGSQYFSASKEFVRKKFPKNDLWRDHASSHGSFSKDHWFSDVYRRIETGLEKK